MHILSGRSSRTLSHFFPIRSLAVLVTAAAVLLCANAQAQIKEPGNHPDYSVELEPHGIYRWAFAPGWANDGFGLGLRATIPIVKNGFVKTINNSIGIGFGLDWTHYSSACWGYYGYWNYGRNYAFPAGYDCSANSVMIPVVMQWNFWLTKVISVFGEPGFAFEHAWYSAYEPCAASPNRWCTYSPPSSTNFDFVFQGGARFMFGDTVGLTVRVGVPYISVGASFLL